MYVCELGRFAFLGPPPQQSSRFITCVLYSTCATSYIDCRPSRIHPFIRRFALSLLFSSLLFSRVCTLAKPYLIYLALSFVSPSECARNFLLCYIIYVYMYYVYVYVRCYALVYLILVHKLTLCITLMLLSARGPHDNYRTLVCAFYSLRTSEYVCCELKQDFGIALVNPLVPSSKTQNPYVYCIVEHSPLYCACIYRSKHTSESARIH